MKPFTMMNLESQLRELASYQNEAALKEYALWCAHQVAYIPLDTRVTDCLVMAYRYNESEVQSIYAVENSIDFAWEVDFGSLDSQKWRATQAVISATNAVIAADMAPLKKYVNTTQNCTIQANKELAQKMSEFLESKILELKEKAHD